eukprot:15148074-Heterocapsa_arctica.AAC.1
MIQVVGNAVCGAGSTETSGPVGTKQPGTAEHARAPRSACSALRRKERPTPSCAPHSRRIIRGLGRFARMSVPSWKSGRHHMSAPLHQNIRDLRHFARMSTTAGG